MYRFVSISQLFMCLSSYYLFKLQKDEHDFKHFFFVNNLKVLTRGGEFGFDYQQMKI